MRCAAVLECWMLVVLVGENGFMTGESSVGVSTTMEDTERPWPKFVLAQALALELEGSKSNKSSSVKGNTLLLVVNGFIAITLYQYMQLASAFRVLLNLGRSNLVSTGSFDVLDL